MEKTDLKFQGEGGLAGGVGKSPENYRVVR